MEVVEGLMTQSAQLREAAYLSDQNYDQRIRETVASLRHVISKKSLAAFASNESLLDHFDPVADSLVYLFLLRAQIQAFQEESRENVPPALLPPGNLWSRIVTYLRAFDPVQVRYAGQEWRQLVEIVAQAAQVVSKPILAVRPVRDAMLRLDPSCAVFTSTHLLLVRLCLRARAYTHALPVLDKYVCHFPTSISHATSKFPVLPCAAHDSSLSFITETSGISSKLAYKDYLQYFLLGGMIYMALKQWGKAAHYLGVVISMPTAGPISMIMVEAYKKWILVKLLENGKVSSPSNLIPSHTAKLYQSLARPYVNLAHSFQRGDLENLEAEVDAGRDIWCTDHNMGLVSQVLSAFSKHTVMGIRQTFAALTVKELADQASSMRMSDDATESAIASFIMSGAVKATLVQHSSGTSSTMLRFSAARSSPQFSDESKAQACLARESQSLGALMESLHEIGHHMGLSNEFVDGMQRGQIWANADDANTGIGEDAGLEIDEDLMGEVP